MVGGLHAAGLRVVLDQVFNHTSASGQAPTSVLDKVVPGYYQRLDANGAVDDLDLLPEHRHRARDGARRSWSTRSVLVGASNYKVDGFRFDLMGHHSRRQHARRPVRAGQADAAQGRGGRQVDLPLRRGLELRRGRRTTPCSSRPPRASSAAPGSAPSPTGCATPSAAAARSTRTRGMQGFGSGLGTDPNGVTRSTARPRTGAGWPARHRPGPAGPGRQPAGVPRSGRSDRRTVAGATRSTTTASRPGTPTSRTR